MRYALALLVGLGALSGGLPGQTTVCVPDAAPFGTHASSAMWQGTCGTCIQGTYALKVPTQFLATGQPNILDAAFAFPGGGTWIAQNMQVGFGHIPSGASLMTLPTPGNSGSLLNFVLAYDSAVQGPFSWTITPNTWVPMGLGGTAFNWDGVHEVLFYMTFSQVTTSGWTGPLGTYETISNSPPRYYASPGYQTTGPYSVIGSTPGMKICLTTGPAFAAWQPNQPEATLGLDGTTGGSAFPLDLDTCVGAPVSVEPASSSAGTAWDLAVTLGEMVPVGGGGVATPGNQILNLDLADPSLGFLFGLTFAAPFAPQGLPFVPSTPGAVHAQMIAFSPGHLDGFALSAPVGLHVNAPTTISGPTLNDTRTVVSFAHPTWCGPPSISFAGTVYTEIYVHDNGYVTFQPEWSDPSVGLTELATSVRLAGWWSDLDPGAGGSITVAPTSDMLVVSWSNVPERSFPAHRANFDLVFDAATGACSISGLAIGVNWLRIALMGLSPGYNATDPGGVPLGSYQGLGPQSGPGQGSMLYQLTGGGALPSFSEIIFPTSDPTLFIVQ